MTKAKINNLANILSIASTFALAIEIAPLAGISFMFWLFGSWANVDLIEFRVLTIMMLFPLLLDVLANCFIKIRSILSAVNATVKLAVAILFIIGDIMLVYSSIIVVLSAGTLICLLISNLCYGKIPLNIV